MSVARGHSPESHSRAQNAGAIVSEPQPSGPHEGRNRRVLHLKIKRVQVRSEGDVTGSALTEPLAKERTDCCGLGQHPVLVCMVIFRCICRMYSKEVYLFLNRKVQIPGPCARDFYVVHLVHLLESQALIIGTEAVPEMCSPKREECLLQCWSLWLPAEPDEESIRTQAYGGGAKLLT